MHPPMHTSCTWTQQPMLTAQWPYPPYPSYHFYQPDSLYRPAPGIQIHHPPVPQPENPSRLCDLFKRPLPSQPMASISQPQQTFDIRPKIQLTSNITLKRSSETEQNFPSKNPKLRTLAPQLHVPQQPPPGLPCVAPMQSHQRVQAAQNAEFISQIQPEQSIQISRRAAHNQLEQNVQVARAALNKSQAMMEQRSEQTAGHRAARSLAQFPARTLLANEPQATTPQQQTQSQPQSANLTPTPRYLSSTTWPSLAPQIELLPKSLLPTETSFVPGLQNIPSSSHADRDRDTLGVSITADEYE